MDGQERASRVTVAGAELVESAGPLAGGSSVVATFGDGTIALYGGEPAAAWQIPLAAIKGLTLSSRRTTTELAGWVAGSHLRLRFEVDTLVGGTTGDLAQLLGVAKPASSRSRPGAPRRRWWLLVAAIIVGLLVGGGAWLVVRSNHDSSAASLASDRSAAASVNLTGRQLPSGFSVDDPSTSPLAGLLGTAPATKPTAAERRDTRAIEDRYRSCLGISYAKDREFGGAGVTPPVEVPSLPYGRIGAAGDIEEVGSVTQRYVSAADVEADRQQMALPRFPACFAAALARFVAGSSSAPVAATAQHLTQPFGAWATGGTAMVQIAGTSGNVPVQIGVSILLAGRDEQYLYTFASAGRFPASLRAQLIAEQGPRLAGLVDTKTA
jgi:hypothetical protein